MMGQNRKRLTNRPRYNPRIESPDFLLTNSVSNSSFESTSTLFKDQSSGGEYPTKKHRGRNEALPTSRKIRSRTSDPASRQKDAIETYIRRYVTSAPENAKRPNPEDDNTPTGTRVRLTDNVRVVFDEDRYRKSLSTCTSRLESSITIRNFSSIHHIADHKRNVCDEMFRNRFTKTGTRKDDQKFDAKRVLSDEIGFINSDDNYDGKIMLISKALGDGSNELETDNFIRTSEDLHDMTHQDKRVGKLLDEMKKSDSVTATNGKRNASKFQRESFRIEGLRVGDYGQYYDEFARDFSDFPQPQPIEETTDMNCISTIDTGLSNSVPIRSESIYIQNVQRNKSDGSPKEFKLKKILPLKLVGTNVESNMITESIVPASEMEGNEIENISEPSMRITLKIPSAEDPDVTRNRFSGHPVVQEVSAMSPVVGDSSLTKVDPCFTCPMCVAEREKGEKQKSIKDGSFILPDSLQATGLPGDEVMDLRSSGIFESKPFLPPSIPEGVELKRVDAYDITTLSGNSERKPDDEDRKEPKTDYRLSLKDVRKEKSSPTLPPSAKTDGNSFHVQGNELQPQDRFSFVSESPIAGFPMALGKQYPIPKFRPSPIYPSKWVVENSSPSRCSTSQPSWNGNITGKTVGASDTHQDSVENEIMTMRIPFLIWRNKQKKEGIASIKDNCKGNTITLNHRPGSSRATKVSGTGNPKKLTLAEQALLTQRMESDRKTAFPCPPNSPAPEQLVELVNDHYEESEDTLSQSHLQDSNLTTDIPA